MAIPPDFALARLFVTTIPVEMAKIIVEPVTFWSGYLYLAALLSSSQRSS
jgi:hypothetical protein